MIETRELPRFQIPTTQPAQSAIDSNQAQRTTSRIVQTSDGALPSDSIFQASGRRVHRVSNGSSLIGEVLLGRYYVEETITSGGMSTIYRGSHLSLPKKVAIKVLDHEKANNSEFCGRLKQEANITSKLQDPNIVAVWDYGVSARGLPFIVMEYIHGHPLSKELKTHGRIELDRVLDYAIQLASALNYIHCRGIVHRDVKPSNCMILSRDSPTASLKLIDFGISKNIQALPPDELEQIDTEAHVILGTAHYMAPELFERTKFDQRVDIYSFGVLLFELVTGVPPFTGPNFESIFDQQLRSEPPSLRTVAPNTKFPPELEDLILKALKKDPDHRFVSVAEMKNELLAIRAHTLARKTSVRSFGDIRQSSSLVALIENQRSSAKQLFADFIRHHVFLGCLCCVATALVFFILQPNVRNGEN